MKAGASAPPMDFLSHIVVKARGAESSIAPRLPAMFEPVAGVELAPMEATEEWMTSVAARELQALQPTSMPSRSPAGMHEPRPLAPRPVRTTEQADERVPGEADRRERAAEGVPVASLQPLPGRAGVVASPATRPAGQRSDFKPETGVLRAASAVLRRAQGRAREVSGPVPNDLHQESGVLIPKPEASPAPYSAIRAAPRADAASAARDFPANTPTMQMTEPPPVINVTIGRVEVRAVQPPAGKPRSEPSRPKPLSLDDYLKQRGGNR